MTDADEAGVIEAAAISCTACQSCDGIHVHFMDDDGEVFAVAVLPPPYWNRFMEQFSYALNEITWRTHGGPGGAQ